VGLAFVSWHSHDRPFSLQLLQCGIDSGSGVDPSVVPQFPMRDGCPRPTPQVDGVVHELLAVTETLVTGCVPLLDGQVTEIPLSH
jgi:hypothetical protein